MIENHQIHQLKAENRKLRKNLRFLEREQELWQKIQFITNAADQLLTMIDREYKYESVNWAYCRARGQKKSDIIGKTVAEVWGEEQFRSVIKPTLDRCFSGESTSYEEWFKFDGFELRCFQVTYTPYPTGGGKVTHAVVVTHDITARKQAEDKLKEAHERLERRVEERTAALEQANAKLRSEIEERKRAEKALRDSEERYRNVSRDMPAMVCRYLPDGTLTFANTRFFNHFHVYSQTIDPTNIFDLFDEKERQCKIERLNNLRPDKPMVTYEQSTCLENGDLLWRQWTDRALFDERGVSLEYQSVIIDITEKKNLEGKLQQAQKMEAIGTLAGGIAHDFNNLLMGIQGNVSLICLDLPHQHPLYENIHSIEELVESGANLTRQLLGFARGGKYIVKPVDLNEVVSKTAKLFGRTRKAIRIHEKYASDDCVVLADRGQIEQVLINLYLNAWQAMFEKGDLYLETEIVRIGREFVKPFEVKIGNYVRVSVTDNGKGIEPDIADRIFDPFFTTKGFGHGSGLGLASVFGIVKNHDGIVDFETRLGKGTTFNIYLPLSGGTDEKPRISTVGIISGPETILLVDDEPFILDVGEKMLNKMGYTVLRASCGEEALKIVEDPRFTIELVILDMIMPDIGGDEVYDRLKAFKPDIKVLLASGNSREDVAGTLDKGCDGFIQKPFSMETLSHAIRKAIDSRKEGARPG